MSKVPATGKDHRHVMFIGGGDHFFVSHRSAGLYYRRGTCFRGHIEPVTKRKERV
jgi:hypothetical protein